VFGGNFLNPSGQDPRNDRVQEVIEVIKGQEKRTSGRIELFEKG
jgi:hypothetical protein